VIYKPGGPSETTGSSQNQRRHLEVGIIVLETAPSSLKQPDCLEVIVVDFKLVVLLCLRQLVCLKARSVISR
jgi:hypothetical protein